ncbi:MAG: dihydrofolate reductase family protein [Gemmatimonadota bacterium]|nr:MAG: dihydrofolate reductase family protein [Gemmatimonadota bacterium]
MKIGELNFQPIRVLYNKVEDEALRGGRRTIWGDLTPRPGGLERAEHDQVPYTYGLFIQSKDGRATDGLEGGVGRMAGQPADRFGQFELRVSVDAFLVGAATLRADRTIGAPLERELIERRKKVKGNAAPLNVFFSATGNFPPESPVFREPSIRTALFVTETAEARVGELKKLTPDVVVVGSESPLRETWTELWRRGITSIGFEGGPTLMGLALREGLVHELLLTHSPLLLGGTGPSLSAIVEPLEGIRSELVFLGLDESSNLIFERSVLIYEDKG